MVKSFRELMRRGEKLIGTFMMTDSQEVLEILGEGGFEFVVIDEEHGGLQDVCYSNLVRTAEAAGVIPIAGPGRRQRKARVGRRRFGRNDPQRQQRGRCAHGGVAEQIPAHRSQGRMPLRARQPLRRGGQAGVFPQEQ